MGQVAEKNEMIQQITVTVKFYPVENDQAAILGDLIKLLAGGEIGFELNVQSVSIKEACL